MVDVYHEFEYPYEMLAPSCARSARRAAGVREFRAAMRAVPIKPLHTMTDAQVRKEGRDARAAVGEDRARPAWRTPSFFRKSSGN